MVRTSSITMRSIMEIVRPAPTKKCDFCLFVYFGLFVFTQLLFHHKYDMVVEKQAKTSNK